MYFTWIISHLDVKTINSGVRIVTRTNLNATLGTRELGIMHVIRHSDSLLGTSTSLRRQKVATIKW